MFNPIPLSENILAFGCFTENIYTHPVLVLVNRFLMELYYFPFTEDPHKDPTPYFDNRCLKRTI